MRDRRPRREVGEQVQLKRMAWLRAKGETVYIQHHTYLQPVCSAKARKEGGHRLGRRTRGGSHRVSHDTVSVGGINYRGLYAWVSTGCGRKRGGSGRSAQSQADRRRVARSIATSSEGRSPTWSLRHVEEEGWYFFGFRPTSEKVSGMVHRSCDIVHVRRARRAS